MVVKLFGNVIRYVLILMDNYAGLYLNFVTMEEYRMKRNDVQGTERAENKQANAKVIYDVDLILSIFIMTLAPRSLTSIFTNAN